MVDSTASPNAESSSSFRSSAFGSLSVFGQTNNAAANPFSPKPLDSGTLTFGSSGTFSSTSPCDYFYEASTTPGIGLSSTPSITESTSGIGSSSVGASLSSPQTQSSTCAFMQSSISTKNTPFESQLKTGQANDAAANPFTPRSFGSMLSSGLSSTFSFASSSNPSFGPSTALGIELSSTSRKRQLTLGFGSSANVPPSVSKGLEQSAPASTAATGYVDGNDILQSDDKLVSISVLPSYKDKSHEELKWEYYQSGLKDSLGKILSFVNTGFERSALGVHHRGSRISSYTATAEYVDGNNNSHSAGKLVSLSAMPSYKGKSHEELKWEDYQLGDKSSLNMSSFVNTGLGGQTSVGDHHRGTRVFSHPSTPDENNTAFCLENLLSISAMPQYKDKSHEELKWEDYELKDKGSSRTVRPTLGGKSDMDPTYPNPSFGPKPLLFSSSNDSNSSSSQTPSSGFWSHNALHVSTNPFPTSISSDLFTYQMPSFIPCISGMTFISPTNSFSSSVSSSPSVPQQLSVTPLISIIPSSNSQSVNSSRTYSSVPCCNVTTSTPAFDPKNTAVYCQSGFPAFVLLPSIFFPTPGQGMASECHANFSFVKTQSAPLSESVAISCAQKNSPSGLITASSSYVSLQSSGSVGNIGNYMPSLSSVSNPGDSYQSSPSFSDPFQPALLSENAFPSSGIIQKFSTGSSGFATITEVGACNASFQKLFNSVHMSTVVSPFKTPSDIPHISTGFPGPSTIQCGISSLSVSDKPSLIRKNSSLIVRTRQSTLTALKNNLKIDKPKVPFFHHDDFGPIIRSRADIRFVPRENPRSFVARPSEKRPSRASVEKVSSPECACKYENGERSTRKTWSGYVEPDRLNGMPSDNCTKRGNSNNRTGQGMVGTVAILYEPNANVKMLMPKLRCPDYYTNPEIAELEAKERAEPGFCQHVKDFVVGRHGYGSIRFYGETDVRKLDLNSLFQFNEREIIVYMDESERIHVGQGLNKPAEVILLNIKCLDKKTGEVYIDGPQVEKYREMLISKAAEGGGEFVSYDPVKGEWKFKVQLAFS